MAASPLDDANFCADMRCPFLLRQDGCIEGACPFYKHSKLIVIYASLHEGVERAVAVIPKPH